MMSQISNIGCNCVGFLVVHAQTTLRTILLCKHELCNMKTVQTCDQLLALIQLFSSLSTQTWAYFYTAQIKCLFLFLIQSDIISL